MIGITIIWYGEEIEAKIASQHPSNLSKKQKIKASDLMNIYTFHRIEKKDYPNFFQMEMENFSVASFFTGFSLNNYVGLPNYSITVFFSNKDDDKDNLSKDFEGYLRRIAYELIPKLSEKNFNKKIKEYYNNLEAGKLEPYWEEYNQDEVAGVVTISKEDLQRTLSGEIESIEHFKEANRLADLNISNPPEFEEFSEEKFLDRIDYEVPVTLPTDVNEKSLEESLREIVEPVMDSKSFSPPPPPPSTLPPPPPPPPEIKKPLKMEISEIDKPEEEIIPPPPPPPPPPEIENQQETYIIETKKSDEELIISPPPPPPVIKGQSGQYVSETVKPEIDFEIHALSEFEPTDETLYKPIISETDEWRARYEALKKEMGSVNERAIELKDLNSQQKQEIDNLKEKVDSLTKDVDEKNTHNEFLKEEISNLKQEYEAYDSLSQQYNQLEQKFNNLTQQNEEFKQNIEKLNNDNEIHINNITELKLKLVETKNKFKSDQKIHDNLEDQMIELKKEIKVLRRERDHYLEIVKENKLL